MPPPEREPRNPPPGSIPSYIFISATLCTRLLGRIPPINRQRHASNISRIVAGQEHGAFRHILHIPPLAPRRQGHNLLSGLRILKDRLRHRRLEICHQVHISISRMTAGELTLGTRTRKVGRTHNPDTKRCSGSCPLRTRRRLVSSTRPRHPWKHSRQLRSHTARDTHSPPQRVSLVRTRHRS